MTKDPMCPECGQRLVERKGKYGEFLGCTGYPECKYTQNIDDYHEAGSFSDLRRDDEGHWK